MNKMKRWRIYFLSDRSPLVIKGDTFVSAVEDYLRISLDLRYANLTSRDLAGANLQGADLTGTYLKCTNLERASLTNAILRGADLTNANLASATLQDADLSYADLKGANLESASLANAILIGANLDYGCLPFSHHSLEIKIDKRIACQLLYHTLRAMQSVEDEEVKAILNDDKVLALANQFHRVDECGEIVKEQPNDQKRILSEREKLINYLIFHAYDCMCQDIETETLKQWLDQLQQVIQVEPKDNL
jgi:uncharacterized protein YjbI with pentapeptide repeats